MRFRDRIFDIFQGLNRPEDDPRTGFGLTVLPKAMHRVRGRAWAQSEPGAGSCVYLELPR
jgi:light-regulated signal transduction histidine kinase (bacteriophytochrome)